jgi:glycogenin glucosyltransferase
LHATLTKLQLWSLAKFRRVLYLDADTLVLQSIDHLFDTVPSDVEFAASPELGFPDCFNAGMMLLTPDDATHRELCAFAREHESFDGGDQGLLNVFFGDGPLHHPAKVAAYLLGSAKNGASRHIIAHRNWYRLSFTYNLEMHKVFRLNIPAILRYRDELRILHFIGKDKPWHFDCDKIERPVDANAYFDFYIEMVKKWWDVRRSINDISD